MFANVSALKIHMSDTAHDAIKAFPEFITEPRGDISVKVRNSSCRSTNISKLKVAPNHF